MALIIEDGTGVAGANSYITIANIRIYATARGVTLDADDAIVETQVFQAMDYLEAQRSRYQGDKTDATNPLQWPRCGVYIDCVAIDDDVIPQELIDAESQLVMDIEGGLILYANTNAGEQQVIKEKVDVLETTYSEARSTSSSANIPSVDRLLEVLYSACGAGGYLKNVRV